MSVLRQETDPQTGPETGPQTLTISDDEDTDIIPFMGYALKGLPDLLVLPGLCSYQTTFR
ncbi:MAG: hypothetical protein WCF07_14035 [Nitrososphaeraceae archaeon]